jgi:hypothetical protein
MRNINGYGMWGGGWGELAGPYPQQDTMPADRMQSGGRHPSTGGYDSSGINPGGMYGQQLPQTQGMPYVHGGGQSGGVMPPQPWNVGQPQFQQGQYPLEQMPSPRMNGFGGFAGRFGQ